MGEQPSYDSQWDAQILADAAVINADTSRLAAAKMAAGKLKEQAKAKLEAFDKISLKVYDHPSSERARQERKK
jgi:hypothetical protein